VAAHKPRTCETPANIKVSTQAYSIGEDDLSALKAHGFTEEDAWDTAGAPSHCRSVSDIGKHDENPINSSGQLVEQRLCGY
jgi:hypothetical protein